MWTGNKQKETTLMKKQLKNKTYLNRYLATTLAATILSFSLVGCGSKADLPTGPSAGQEVSDTTAPSDESDANNVALSFKPSESGMPAKEQ